MAWLLWASRNPIGEQVWVAGTPYEVVGVVADYKHAALQNIEWAPAPAAR
jgi:hypothetical protein